MRPVAQLPATVHVAATVPRFPSLAPRAAAESAPNTHRVREPLSAQEAQLAVAQLARLQQLRREQPKHLPPAMRAALAAKQGSAERSVRHPIPATERTAVLVPRTRLPKVLSPRGGELSRFPPPDARLIHAARGEIPPTTGSRARSLGAGEGNSGSKGGCCRRSQTRLAVQGCGRHGLGGRVRDGLRL